MIALLTPFKEARLRAGLSQRDLEALSGVSKSTISSADRGMVPASRDHAIRLADALGGIPLSDLGWEAHLKTAAT